MKKESKMVFQARQGDVYIEEIAGIPKDAKPKDRVNGDIILAYGEVTGHAHRIKDRTVQWFAGPDDATSYLSSDPASTATLTHEEHSEVVLPAGKKFIARRQREWDEDAERMVAD